MYLIQPGRPAGAEGPTADGHIVLMKFRKSLFSRKCNMHSIKNVAHDHSDDTQELS